MLQADQDPSSTDGAYLRKVSPQSGEDVEFRGSPTLEIVTERDRTTRQRTATLDSSGPRDNLVPQTVALMHLAFSERETHHSHPAQEKIECISDNVTMVVANCSCVTSVSRVGVAAADQLRP